MPGPALLLIGLLATGASEEYARPLAERAFDQAAFDAETYGVKKAMARESDGLRVRLAAGAEETGWKTPAALKVGGDFTITANLTIKTLPKPLQADGAAIGLAIAFGDVNQPDLTLVRLTEPGGASVYRAIGKGGADPAQAAGPDGAPMNVRQRPGMPAAAAKAAAPTRRVFPAAGDEVRLELRREKTIVRFQVLDAKLDRPRYLGQFAIGANDIAAVKLFVSNRNGAEPVDVLWRDLSIRADRLTGLGTTVRTVFGQVVYGEPTAIEDGVLIVGGPPKAVPPAAGPEKPPAANAPADAPAPKPDAAPTTPQPTSGQVAEPESAPTPKPFPSEAAPPAGASTPAPEAKPPEPKARIPLGDLESIRFERPAVLAARFIGQANVDLTRPPPDTPEEAPKPDDEAKPGPKPADPEPKADALAPPPGTTVAKVPKVEPEKNGIVDVGLALSGLRAAKVKQITVNCQTDKGATAWRLDTSDSHDWPLALRRSGVEPWGEIFLEPPPGDSFEKEYQVNVAYEDGQAGTAKAKATAHTDPKRPPDPDAPTVPNLGATVHLTGDETLYGTLEEIGPEALRLAPPWGDQGPLEVPLSRVVGVQLSTLDRKETPESFAKRLKARSADDLLLARTKDGEVLPIAGIVEGTEADRLRFRYQEKTRTLPLDQVEGWVMADRPDPRPAEGPDALVSMLGGLAASGVWKNLDAQTWTIEVPWGQSLKVPAAEIQGVRIRGGTMTYLCDLEPGRADETPFFGHRMPWRRDVNLLGGPIRIGDRTFEHGLAVHSRSRLTFDLNGKYARFETLVGFDESARGKGRVDCRVVADDRPIFERVDLRGDQPPVPLSLDVSGAAQLRLEVDFGADQDTGDRIIWANPRLFRPETPGTEDSADK